MSLTKSCCLLKTNSLLRMILEGFEQSLRIKWIFVLDGSDTTISQDFSEHSLISKFFDLLIS